MDLVKKLNTQLPFSHLLAIINVTHRNGLDIESES